MHGLSTGIIHQGQPGYSHCLTCQQQKLSPQYGTIPKLILLDSFHHGSDSKHFGLMEIKLTLDMDSLFLPTVLLPALPSVDLQNASSIVLCSTLHHFWRGLLKTRFWCQVGRNWGTITMFYRMQKSTSNMWSIFPIARIHGSRNLECGDGSGSTHYYSPWSTSKNFSSHPHCLMLH